MDIVFGRVTGQSSEPIRDAEGNKRVLQVEVTDESDVRPVEWIDQPGQDAPPANDDQVLVVETGGSFDIATAADDQVEKVAKGGEYLAYSRVINLKQAQIYLMLDGSVVITSQPGGAAPVATISMTPAGAITIAAQQIVIAPGGGAIELAGNARDASGVGDSVTIDPTTDPAFFTWVNAVSAGLVVPIVPPAIPTTATGEISSGASKVKLP